VTPAEYCAAKAAPPGSSAYYALLYHEDVERRALSACLALLEELQPDFQRIAEPSPAVRRLLWWRDELDPARFHVSRHPVAMELGCMALDPATLCSAYQHSIGAALRELEGWQPDTAADWHAHCRELYGAPWHLAARICGSTPDHADGGLPVGTLAALHGQIEQLLQFGPRTAAGRCPLPKWPMGCSGANSLSESPPRTELQDVIAAQAITLQRELLAVLQTAPRRIPVFFRVMGRIDSALCDRILARPERLMTDRISLTPLRKLWIAWNERAR
jgi:phytoene synthase